MAEKKSQYKKPHPNVIAGWKRKKYIMNPAQLSGLVPFIKLYAITSKDELDLYRNVLKRNQSRSASEPPPRLPQGFINSFGRAVNLIVNAENSTLATLNSTLVGDTNTSFTMLDMNPPEPQGPANNWTGGFGIKDLKCTRTTESPFSETFSLQVQLNDPNLIRNKYEYNKMIQVGSNFLLLYGWSSLAAEAGYDKNNVTYTIDYSDNAYYNGKDWRFCFVQLHKFNWDFNELGQMTGTLDFIAAQNSELIFNMGGRMGKLGKAAMYFMNSRFLGGPEAANRAVGLIGTFTDAKEEADITIEETTAANLFAAENLGLESNDAADDDDSRQGTINSKTIQLAMMGNLGSREIWVRKEPGRRTFMNFKNDFNRPDFASSDYENPSEKRAHYVRAGFVLVGWYLEGYGFREATTGIWASSPGGLGVGGKGYMMKHGGVFLPIVYNKETDEIKWLNPYSANWNTGANRNYVAEYVTYKNNTSSSNLNIGTTGGKNTLVNYINSISLASSEYDKTFMGYALFDELNIPNGQPTGGKDWSAELRNLKEGIILTKYGYGSGNAVNFVNREWTTGASQKIVLGEDIVYYYLGWLIEALRYYNKQFGGKDIRIVHTEFGNEALEPLNRFRNNFRTQVARQITSELGENVTYSNTNLKRINDPANAGKKLEPRAEMIPSSRSTSQRWAKYKSGIEIAGVYYKEAERLVPNLISPEAANDIFWEENTTQALKFDGSVSGQLKFIKKSMFEKGRYPTSLLGGLEGSEQVEVVKRGNDIFFPLRSSFPVREVTYERDDRDPKAFDGIKTSGFDMYKMRNTTQVILDANKVDDVLSNAVGKSFPDILTQIITSCVAMEGLGLILTPQSNGDLVLEAAGQMSSDEEQFNMDYNPQVDATILSEGNNFIIDYRTGTSLLKSLNVNAKMDPNIAFMYGSSVRAPGGKKDMLKVIAEKNRSSPNPSDKSFSEFARNWMIRNKPNDEDTINNIRAAEDKLNNYSAATTTDQDFETLLESLPEGLFSDFLAEDYKLYERIAVEQMNNSNQLSQMFSYYMNQLTVTIHGTTGLECMQFVQIRNVASLLDGFYCIIGITESVSSNDFTTELNLMLIAPSTILEPKPEQL